MQSNRTKVAAGEYGGFAGTCDTTLTDWIQLVQMGRRDAVMTVRSPEGKEGTLWCRQGDIIDATCEGLAGEDAVYKALSWQSGRVAVDFRPFQHRRRIQTPTAGLLLEAALIKDSAGRDLASTQKVPVDDSPSTTAAANATGLSAVLGRHRRLVVLLSATAGLAALVLLWGPVSRSMFRGRSGSEAPARPASEVLVRIDVDPAHADIFLDGKQVGVGHFQKTLPRDGRRHEILCSAPGRVTERLIFRDAPPRQIVTLQQSEDGRAVVETGGAAANGEPVLGPALTLLAQTQGGPTRHRTVAPQAKRTNSSTIDRARGASAAKVNGKTVEERSPRIQIIDEPAPRIQIIDERSPRIQAIR